MASRSILRSAIAAALIGASPILVPAVTGQIAPAAAGVNVSVNFNAFYGGMANYGDWMSYRGAYIWVPTSVGPSWRPYTLGHWVWTDEYGWMWVSDEPFGWAAYHYGRWGYSNEFGWYWVPGRRWAPAWVSWRNSDDIVGWAPLPPENDETVVNININTLPDYYWNVVPTRSFLSPSLSASLVFDVGQRRQLFQSGRPGGNVIIRNNVVVNNFIGVNYISQRTGQQIRPVRVVSSDKPGNALLQGNQVTAFTGNVGRDNNVKPAKIVDVNQVKVTVKDRVKRGKPVTEVGLPANGVGQNAGGAGQTDNGQNANGKVLGKPKGNKIGGPAAGTDQSGQGAGQNNGTVTDQTKNKLNKKKLPPNAIQQNGTGGGDQLQQGGAGQGGGADQNQLQGGKKNKKKLIPNTMDQSGQGMDQSGQGMDQSGPGVGNAVKKNKRKLVPNTMDQSGQGMDQSGQGMDQSGQNMGNPGKKNRKKPVFMDNTDQSGQGMGNGGGGNGDMMQQQRPNRRNKQLQQNNGMDQGGQMNGGGQIQRQPRKLPGKPAKCDPQTDPSCPPTLN